MQIPTLRRHSAAQQAYVRHGGKQIYLGVWPPGEARPSPEAEAAYRRFVARLAADAEPARESVARGSCKVSGLTLLYLDYAERKYVKDGEDTRQIDRIRGAVGVLVELHGPTVVDDLQVDDLELVQAAMQNRPCGTCRGSGRGPKQACKRCDGVGRRCWVRRLINQSMACLRQMFRWGARRGLLRAETAARLDLVEPLRVGQGGREVPKVKPVTDAVLAATLEHLGPVPAGMVRLQLLAGMRPQEVCLLTLAQIDRDGIDPDGIEHVGVWIYCPARHKTQHHGATRTIFLGPLAQALLAPLIVGLSPEEYVFSPRRAVQDMLTESGRKVASSPVRLPGDHYTAATYGRAVARACLRAGVPRWSPNQLRHLAATRIRAATDLDTAGTVLDHAHLETTRIYAEQARAKAAEIMRRMG